MLQYHSYRCRLRSFHLIQIMSSTPTHPRTVAPPPASMYTNNPNPKFFPKKLYNLINQAATHGYADFLAWDPSGTSFRILKPGPQLLPILDRYQFRVTKFVRWNYITNILLITNLLRITDFISTIQCYWYYVVFRPSSSCCCHSLTLSFIFIFLLPSRFFLHIPS